MASVGDWGELIDEAEAERFVGREQELETFRQQISIPKPRYLIFYITGQGGAGKTTLLNRYREIAEEFSFLLVDCDEQQRDVPAVLGRFAQQLEEQGFPLKHFNERYKNYRQKMHEIENDPEAPQGLAAILARTVVRAAYIGSDAVPIVRKGLEFIPREAVETQASEWATYLSKKLTNKEELALVREPIPILTPLFFEELNKLTQTRKVLLCFDNFEAARPELREWLLHLKEYRPSQNIRIIIAGRDQPGAKWDPLRGVTQTVRIDVFTEQEAETFLDTYSITNPKRRTEILELSGRLPVLMSWLAAVEGNEIEPTIPTHDIVERFLRWITDPALRDVALLAAIPRTINTDILKLLLENRDQTLDEQTAFDWLQTMTFVNQSSEGWYYHDVVRRMMLQYQRQKSPQTYQQMHAVLANFYNTQRHELSSPEEEQWTNEEWRKYSLIYVYHYLVADPYRHWGKVMTLFVVAMRERWSFAIEMIKLLNFDDVHDELSHEQRICVHLFLQQLQAVEAGDLKDAFEMFDKLSSISDLSLQAKGYTIAYRGESNRLDKKWEKALFDFEEALNCIPHDAWTIASRGEVFLEIERYQEALADFDRAISLNDEFDWAIANRGRTYALMGRYQEALADFDRAIELDEKDTWAIANRGWTYLLMERYQEALADFDRAIELDEKYTWAIAGRGEVFLEMERYQEALTDFNRAIELDEKDTWAIANRGRTYQEMGRFQEALADFDRAIVLDEKYTWAITNRGTTFKEMGRFQEALADFDRAIALDEKYDWAIANRGTTYQEMGRFQEALADFDRAIALDEKYDWAIANRGWTYLLMERYQEALADFDRAIELDEKYTWAIANRGRTYLLMERYQEALADFDRAISLNDEFDWAIANRGRTYLLMERYQDALTDFNRAIELDEKDTWAIADRGRTYQEMGRFQEALADFDRAIALDDQVAWLFYERGKTYRLMGSYQEALADFIQAIALDSNYTDAYIRKGETHLLLGNYQEALADTNHVIALNEKKDWRMYIRALVYLLKGQINEFESDIEAAIELGQSTLTDEPENYQYGFNLALYNLVAEKSAKAEEQYNRLASACILLPRLQEAVDDLTDYLTLKPSNELAQSIRTRLRTRIEELNKSPNE